MPRLQHSRDVWCVMWTNSGTVHTCCVRFAMAPPVLDSSARLSLVRRKGVVSTMGERQPRDYTAAWRARDTLAFAIFRKRNWLSARSRHANFFVRHWRQRQFSKQLFYHRRSRPGRTCSRWVHMPTGRIAHTIPSKWENKRYTAHTIVNFPLCDTALSLTPN